MSLIHNRLPSRNEALLIFGTVSFPVFAWANLQVLREMPSWILRMSRGEIVGGLAYVETFALVESLLLFVGLVGLMMFLPADLMDGRRVSAAFIATLAFTLATLTVHFSVEVLRQWGWVGVLGGVTAFLSLTVGLTFFALRSERMVRLFQAIVERVVLLSFLYTAVGVLGLVVVLVRNL